MQMGRFLKDRTGARELVRHVPVMCLWLQPTKVNLDIETKTRVKQPTLLVVYGQLSRAGEH